MELDKFVSCAARFTQHQNSLNMRKLCLCWFFVLCVCDNISFGRRHASTSDFFFFAKFKWKLYVAVDIVVVNRVAQDCVVAMWFVFAIE